MIDYYRSIGTAEFKHKYDPALLRLLIAKINEYTIMVINTDNGLAARN